MLCVRVLCVRCWRGALIPFLKRREFDRSQKKRFFFASLRGDVISLALLLTVK